jgi:hypothetical protein
MKTRLPNAPMRCVFCILILFLLFVNVVTRAQGPAVLVDASTPGYYNNALGTVLDGTQPQFPLPLGLGDDPTLVPASEPNLSAAAGVLGNWLASPPVLNANWQWQSPVPTTWNVNSESAIIYPIFVGTNGATNVLGDFDADNGLFVWVNGQYKFGAVAPGLPSPTGQYEYTNINLGTLPPGTNYIQVLREDSGVATGFQIRITGLTSSEPPQPPTSQPPVITDFSPKSGTNGSLVTLTGQNFSPLSSNNVVHFGAVRAPVIAASSTSLTVIVPNGATHESPSVTVGGLTGVATAQFLPTFAGGNAPLSATSFAPRVDLAHSGGPIRTVIADLDGDGKPDLAVGDASSHGISLYRNISTAGTLDVSSFAPRVFIPTPAVSESPWEIVAADVDGDGKLDLLEANRGNNTIAILRNTATPGNLTTSSFAPSVNLAAGDLPVGVAAKDIDGDGRADLVAANLNSGNVAVFRNLGAAGSLSTNDFAAPVFFPAEAGTHSLVVADLDGDSKPDIATANHIANSVSILRNTAVAGVINSSSFAPQFSLPAPSYALNVQATDVDGDGKTDLLVSSVFGFALSVYGNVATPGSLTASSFAARVDFGLGGRGHTISHGDLNGDGKPDIVVDTEIDSYVSVFQNLSTPGSFNSASLGARVDLGTGWNAWGASVGDLDGDGRPDIVFCNSYDNTISLYRNVVAPAPEPVDPPVITQQPTNQLATEGDDLAFTVTASGSAPLAYQWSLNGSPIAGATGSTLAFVNVTPAQAGVYTVTVTNTGGVVVSSNALLSVIPKLTQVLVDASTPGYYNNALGMILDGTDPALPLPLGSGGDDPNLNPTNSPNLAAAVAALGDWLNHPPSLNANWTFLTTIPASWNVNEESAIIYPVVVGSNGLTDVRGDFDADNGLFVWVNGQYKFGGVAPGFSSPAGQYEYTNVSLGDLPPGTNYIQVLREDNGVGTGYSVRITHSRLGPLLPTIVQSPASQTAPVNSTMTMTVVATGAAPLGYQWRYEGDVLLGATNASLTLSNVQFAQAGNYSVQVSNAFGTAQSAEALLTVVGVPPAITTQPQDRTIFEGRSTTFSVTVNGTAPLSYQWRREGEPLNNATSANLTLTNVQFSQAGGYDVVATNLYGAITSRVASLIVRPAPVCVPLPEGAVAWWPGQSNSWDVVGGLDGLWTNAFGASYSTGKVGSGFRFLGAHVQVNHNGELDLGAGGGLTMEAWVRPDTSSILPVMEWNDGAGNVGAGLLIGNGGAATIEATLTDTNTPKRVVTIRSAPGFMTLQTWKHVALTYDKVSGLAQLLVNGQVVAQTNAPGLRLQTAAPMFLGHRRSGTFAGARLNGVLDDATVYNRALSVAEVQGIFAADEAGKCAPPPPPCVTPPSGLIAWWRGESNLLDSAAGNTIRLTPSNFSATLTYQTGAVNTAFAYRGQNFLSLPRTEVLDVGKELGFTFEAWIFPNQSRPMPIVEWTDSNSFGASLWTSPQLGPTVLEANLVDSFGGYHVLRSPSGTIVPNTWQHVALTYNRSNGLASLYVNGNNVVTATNLGSFMPMTDLPIWLGAHPGNPVFTGAPGSLPSAPTFFSGALDEIGLYRRPLNGQEIRNLARVRTGKCLDLPPTIGRQPQDTVVAVGSALSLNVVVGGSAPLSYQWFRNGQPIAGANTPTWELFAQQGDAGDYTVVVTNLFGSVTSRAATVNVLPFQQCVPAPSGAVAFWRGESNTLDELGNHPAAWGSNTVPFYTFPQTGGGKVSTAFRFTGSNHLLVNSNANLNVAANGGFTVEGWIKPDTYTGTMPVFEWNDGRGNIGVGLMFGRTGPGVLEVTLTDYAGISSDRSVTFATPNYAIGGPTNSIPPWAHVAVTYDGFRNRVAVYVNGVSVAERMLGSVYVSPAYKRFVPSTSVNLYFGWRPAGLNSGTRFRGVMDELSVYYRPLAALELRTIFLADSYGKCAPAPACLAVPADAAAWWRMEGNLQDSVNTNHALGLNGTLLYTNGVAGTALSFPSFSSAYVRASANPTLNVGTAPGMTFETWLRPANVGSTYTIAAWNNGSGQQGVSLGGSVTRGGDYLEANLLDTVGNSHIMVAPFRVLTNNAWQHVAMTYDKSTGIGALFVDGSPVTVTNLGLFTPRTSDSLYLGYRPVGGYGGSGWRYSGLMDETLLHARALSGGEITASYRNAAGRCTEPPVIVQQPQPATLRVNAGSDVTFSILATGNPVLRYQWFQGRSPIYDFNQKVSTNAQKPTLTLTNVDERRQGSYYCTVSNAFGFAVSSNATLLVNYPPVANASNTVAFYISPNDLDSVVVLDGSRSSDPDRDPLSHEWFLAGSPTPLATGVVAVVTLPVGVHPLELVVSDGLLAQTNSVMIEIITTAQAVERLAVMVQEGTENPAPLVASLRTTIAAINRGKAATAINQLNAFINKVQAQVAPVDPELAAQLIAEAQTIIDILSGGGTATTEAIEITSIQPDETGKPRLRIKGKAGRTLIVETSTDGVTWSKIGVATDKGGDQFEFDDSGTEATVARFYRVVLPK